LGLEIRHLFNNLAKKKKKNQKNQKKKKFGVGGGVFWYFKIARFFLPIAPLPFYKNKNWPFKF
jgi:hypothetical protein